MGEFDYGNISYAPQRSLFGDEIPQNAEKIKKAQAQSDVSFSFIPTTQNIKNADGKKIGNFGDLKNNAKISQEISNKDKILQENLKANQAKLAKFANKNGTMSENALREYATKMPEIKFNSTKQFKAFFANQNGKFGFLKTPSLFLSRWIIQKAKIACIFTSLF